MRTLVLMFCLMIVGAVSAGDWPHWRGPDRDGNVAESSGVIGKEPVWRTKLGIGCSSPIVVGDRLYTMSWGGNRERVHCLDAATGTIVWQKEYRAPEYGRYHLGDEGFYGGPNSTPEFDEATQMLFTLGSDGDLHGWDASNGEKRWHLNLYDTYKAPQRFRIGRSGHRDYGYTTAPLVHGDSVLVEVGSPESGLVIAFDKRTGKQLWASEAKQPAGHAGGLVSMTVEGVPCVGVLALTEFVVMRLDRGSEGKTVGKFEWVTDFGNNIPTPVVAGDRVFLATSAAGRSQAGVVRVRLNGMTKEWKREDIGPSVCSPVVIKERVYFVQNRLICLDLATGKTVWEGGKFGIPGSCIVMGDGRMIVWGGTGVLAVVDPAERYNEVSRLEVGRDARNEAWPHLAVAGGKIFCKLRMGELFCFAITK